MAVGCDRVNSFYYVYKLIIITYVLLLLHCESTYRNMFCPKMLPTILHKYPTVAVQIFMLIMANTTELEELCQVGSQQCPNLSSN